MDRRTFLKLGAAIGAGVALPLSMGSKVEPSGCSGSGGSDSERKGRQPMKPQPDDHRRYICKYSTHRSPGLVIFGTFAKDAHVKRYPAHRYYVHEY